MIKVVKLVKIDKLRRKVFFKIKIISPNLKEKNKLN